jgi:DNA-directed RNA polymerase specialized sigma24 family protein
MAVLDPAVRARFDAEWKPLIQRVAIGDTDGFGRLYDLASPFVFLLTRLVLQDEKEAEEATFEAFEELWRRAVEFDPSLHSASSWVARIANERALARRRMAAGVLPGEIRGRASTPGGSSSGPDARTCQMRTALVSV